MKPVVKAGLAALIAQKILPDTPTTFLGIETSVNILGALFAGSFGVIGHNFPIWLKFKGGKGVSSAFGFILMTQWQIALIALAIWLTMAFTFRYSSLSALTAAVSMPIVAFFLCPPIYAIFYSATALLVIIRHHANIRRLVKGEESKISFKKKS